MLSHEYIAGFFDGDGSIGFTSSLTPKISFAQKDRKVLDEIQRVLGRGGVRAVHGPHGMIYRLVLSGREDVTWFLRNIGRHCFNKKKQIAAALALVGTVGPQGRKRTVNLNDYRNNLIGYIRNRPERSGAGG